MSEQQKMSTGDTIGLICLLLIVPAAVWAAGYGLGLEDGVEQERSAWRSGIRYLDRSGCVWVSDEKKLWKPDNCKYSSPPVPKATAEAKRQ